MRTLTHNPGKVAGSLARWPLEALTRLQDVPKSLPEHLPGGPERPPGRSQEALKKLQSTSPLKSSEEIPRSVHHDSDSQPRHGGGMGRRPRSPRETLRGPPQGFQEASTGTQEPPRQPQEAPKKLPGNPHERPNSPAEAPDSPPNKPQRAPMGTLTHKPSHGGGIAPRRPRWPLKSLRLRRLQDAPRSLQEHPPRIEVSKNYREASNNTPRNAPS